MTALEFSDAWPKADVWAFEPGAANFARLKSNLVGKPDIRLHQIALGDEPGRACFNPEPDHPSMARITDEGSETIELETLDNFATKSGVSSIDLLKIDVEGFELQVLRGAERMLAEGRIAIIRVETAIDPDIHYHTQLWDLCELLHPFGYRLFGFYDQWEFPLENTPKLRRFDAVFISQRLQTRDRELSSRTEH